MVPYINSAVIHHFIISQFSIIIFFKCQAEIKTVKTLVNLASGIGNVLLDPLWCLLKSGLGPSAEK